MYLALYGPKGLVIFDHPYNAESERPTSDVTALASVCRLSGSERIAADTLSAIDVQCGQADSVWTTLDFLVADIMVRRTGR